jgi:predicted metal-dependent peptidase
MTSTQTTGSGAQPLPANIDAALRQALDEFPRLAKQQEPRIRQARARMIMRQRFWGALATALELHMALVGTACTDGRAVWWDPRLAAKLTNAQLEFVWAHEVMHCAMRHPTRRRHRLPGRWNKAADYAINPLLQEEGFDLPTWVLNDKKYLGMSTETIYDLLTQQNPNDEDEKMIGTCWDGNGIAIPGGDLEGTGIGGFFCPTDVQDPAAEAELEQRWMQNINAAAHAARAAGKLSAGLSRLVNELNDPPLPWEAILKDYIDRMVKTQHNWMVPNKRHAYRGILLPSMTPDHVGPLALIVDTSGSITQGILNKLAHEIQAIVEQVRPTVVRVYYVDAKVCGVEEFQSNDPIELHPSGGGGTSFRPAFERMEEDDYEPVAAIYFTDLYSSDYPDPPDFPVLWAWHGTHKGDLSRYTPPFGDMVEIR